MELLATIAATDQEGPIKSLIQMGLLNIVRRYCHYNCDKIKLRMMYAISNLCASSDPDIIDQIFNDYPLLVEIQRTIEQEAYKNKKEALIAMSNLMINASIEQSYKLSTEGFSVLLLQGLAISDFMILQRCLKGIYMHLNSGRKVMRKKNLYKNPFQRVLEIAGLQNMLDKVEEVNITKNKSVLQWLDRITSEHYEVDLGEELVDDEEDEVGGGE
jgi:hypothetical protein